MDNLKLKTFEEYIEQRVKKFGERERKGVVKIEENLFQYDKYLAIHLTNDLTNVGFRFVCSNNNKYYYQNI